MNAGQQQRALQAALQGAQQTAAALQAIAGGNGGTPTVPALYLDFLPQGLRGAPRRFFGYNMHFSSIAAAGGVGTDTFSVQSDSDFLCVALTAAINDPAAPETADDGSGLTIFLEDSGSGRNWLNEPAAFDAMVGTGQLPAYLPYPAFVDRSSQVQATITNEKSADAVEVRLTFLGFKIFSPRSAGL